MEKTLTPKEAVAYIYDGWGLRTSETTLRKMVATGRLQTTGTKPLRIIKDSIDAAMPDRVTG